MDFLTFQFFKDSFEKLNRSITTFTRTMSALVTKLKEVLEYQATEKAGILAELAAAKAATAEALANDVADADAITAALAAAEFAQAEAAAAQVRIAELQALADADVEEDAAISALLDGVIPVPPAEEPVAPPAEEPAAPVVDEPAVEEPVAEEPAAPVEEASPEEPVS
jgi:hypothetical protein